jgi:hypothetical protein
MIAQFLHAAHSLRVLVLPTKAVDLFHRELLLDRIELNLLLVRLL